MSFFKKKRGLHAISPSQKRNISPLSAHHGTIRPKKGYIRSMKAIFLLFLTIAGACVANAEQLFIGY